MKITKKEGMFISFLIMTPYMLAYYWWVKDSSYSLQLTGLFFFGIFLHFLRKIEAGTMAELVFFEKALGVYWTDGLCLIPSILPALHNVGIHLLWNLKKDSPLMSVSFNPNVNIHHHRDQRIPEFKVNSDATLFQATMYRFFGSIGNWFFSLETKNPELVFQKLGFRIILIALVLGWGAGFFPQTSSNTKRDVERSGEVSLVVVINKKPITHFPNNEAFTVDYRSNVQNYGFLDGVRLFSYHKRNNEMYPTIHVDGALCAVVPAGEKIGFKTKTPPVYAANIKNKVHYAQKIEYINIIKRNLAFLFFLFSDVQGFQETSDDWGYVLAHWEIVDNDRYNIVAEALDKKDIPDNVAGGLVCF